MKKNTKTLNIDRTSSIRDILYEKIPFKNAIFLALALNSLNLITVLALQKNLPPQVPLFYGLAQDEQQLASSLGLLIPGVLSFLLIFTNIVYSIFLENCYLQKILSITSFTVSLLSIITVAKIIFLVGFF